MSQLHEECGVFGVWSPTKRDVSSLVYYGLYALQHRGQESCGIVVNDDGLFTFHKDVGLVNDVFTHDVMKHFPGGTMAIGHVRYATTGSTGRENAQPIVVNHIKGRMALAHNGNLVNAAKLRKELELRGSIFHSSSDTEVISYEIIKERLEAPSIEEAVNRAMNRIEGAYSLVIMSPSKLIAARDPYGFRPLCYGHTPDGTYIVASEECAINACGGTLIRDIEPGEVLVFSHKGIRSIKDHCGIAKKKTCIFEYIYFARPDSSIDGVSVHAARARAGACLAKAHPVEADVVIGVPDSGLDGALGYARASGIPYDIGFIKNKYIGRTFIAPGQGQREALTRIKLNTISETINGKRVVMVDDSIVRGTTVERIVRLIREAGAKEVHVRITAPPFMHPCYYGTDIDSTENLIACHHSVEETARLIGADSLGYLPIEDLKELVGNDDYCRGCFNGDYPTQIPMDEGKNRFEQKIHENK